MKVAFIGKMFSGKTTSAQYLEMEEGFTRLAFADPVKDISAALLEYIDRSFEFHGIGPRQKWSFEEIQRRKGEPQIRKLLQLVGTELGRELYDKDVWVKLLLKRAAHQYNVAVDDCRFENEAEELKNAGFTIVRVERPEEDRRALLLKKYPDTWREIMAHPSETSLDNYKPDAVLYAETLTELEKGVDALVERYY